MPADPPEPAEPFGTAPVASTIDMAMGWMREMAMLQTRIARRGLDLPMLDAVCPDLREQQMMLAKSSADLIRLSSEAALQTLEDCAAVARRIAVQSQPMLLRDAPPPSPPAANRNRT